MFAVRAGRARLSIFGGFVPPSEAEATSHAAHGASGITRGTAPLVSTGDRLAHALDRDLDHRIGPAMNGGNQIGNALDPGVMMDHAAFGQGRIGHPCTGFT